MSDNTIRTALKSLGYDSARIQNQASTLYNEQGWSPDAIKCQLAQESTKNNWLKYLGTKYSRSDNTSTFNVSKF